LPWATDSTYNALVQNFKTANWGQAVLTAADLGHYVGDGFMPLHIAANYDGQLSAQTGFHRRYEETMIDRNIDGMTFIGSSCHKIPNVQSYIFKYLYENHAYVQKLLQADKTAFIMAGEQYNEAYFESLWKNSNLFTIKLLEESSKTAAALIYTAWLEAGKPKIPANL
jgi:hypothetical protein